MLFFYLLIAVLPLEEHWFWRQELFGSFTIVKALGVVCFLAALGRIFLSHADPKLFRGSVGRWYLGLLIFQCGSYFIHITGTGVDMSVYWHVASIVMLLIVTVTFVDSPGRLFRTLLVAVCGVAFASLYTIRGQQGGGGADVRPSGIFADANYYALVVGLWIPLAYLWAFSRRAIWVRVLCFGCFASTLLGSLFAASRGGALGLAAALLFLIWHSQRRFRNLVILGALVPILLLYTPSSLLRRFLSPGYGDAMAEKARIVVWKAALRMVRAHPLTGVGLGNFKSLVLQYEDPETRVQTVAHNSYLETAAELGVPGLIVHLGVLIAAFVTLGRVRRRANALGMAHFYSLALGLQAGLVSYFVSSFFVTTWWQNIVWLLIFLSICADNLSLQAALSRHMEIALPESNDLQFAHS